jgi:DNA-directed RNA polymerase specialized sigma24 family protein
MWATCRGWPESKRRNGAPVDRRANLRAFHRRHFPMSACPQTDPQGFPDTAWSTILRAGSGDGDDAVAALHRLCRRYEPAIRRSFQRVQGNSAVVDDLVQGFFAEKFLRPQFLAGLERDGGRFRDFIRTCVRNYHRTCWRRVTLQQPPGTHCPLNAEGAPEPAAPGLTPDQCLDREWAGQLLALARERLRLEAEAAQMTELFQQFATQLDDPAQALAHPELAARLGKSENAVAVALHRLRARFGWLVHDEIRQTVPDPTQWRAERDHLLAALAAD